MEKICKKETGQADFIAVTGKIPPALLPAVANGATGNGEVRQSVTDKKIE